MEQGVTLLGCFYTGAFAHFVFFLCGLVWKLSVEPWWGPNKWSTNLELHYGLMHIFVSSCGCLGPCPECDYCVHTCPTFHQGGEWTRVRFNWTKKCKCENTLSPLVCGVKASRPTTSMISKTKLQINLSENYELFILASCGACILFVLWQFIKFIKNCETVIPH